MPYRVKVDYTYNTTANATTARNNINTYLSAQGRPETASGTGTQVFLQIDGLTEAEATTLGNGLTSRWAVGTRSGVKASVVRRPDE
jgi:hypothetical protein